MDKLKRTPVIAGNWKMNMTKAQTKAFFADFIAKMPEDNDCKIVFCVPFTNIDTAVEATKNTCIEIGAQNVHFAEKGAYTGEISADMLKETGINYIICGHSERRQYFGETDETVGKRMKAGLENGFTMIFCIGETKEERESGITEEVLLRQLKVALENITAEEMKNVIIAYEPVWAIGTGLVATTEQAQDACKFVRRTLSELYGAEIADGVVIQYGGSMNDKNAKELLAQPDIDGGLIGGASLKPDAFAEIIRLSK